MSWVNSVVINSTKNSKHCENNQNVCKCPVNHLDGQRLSSAPYSSSKAAPGDNTTHSNEENTKQNWEYKVRVPIVDDLPAEEPKGISGIKEGDNQDGHACKSVNPHVAVPEGALHVAVGGNLKNSKDSPTNPEHSSMDQEKVDTDVVIIT